MRKKIGFGITMFILVGLSVSVLFSLFGGRDESDLQRFPVPNSWELLSTEDTLVTGVCLGGGAECGHILSTYSTNGSKENVLAEATELLRTEGWTVEGPVMVNDETQMTARKGEALMYLSVFDGGARIKYEENHQTQ